MTHETRNFFGDWMPTREISPTVNGEIVEAKLKLWTMPSLIAVYFDRGMTRVTRN